MGISKRVKSAVAISTMAAFLLTGCGGTNSKETGAKGEEQTVINLYSGGSDNVRIGWERVIKGFEATHPDIQVNLEFLSSGTGGQTVVDKLIAAEKAGEKSIDMDIIELGDNELSRIAAEVGIDALREVDASIVPNMANATQQSVVAEGRAMAHRGTTVVLVYDEAKVAKPPQTAEELYQWIQDHPGRFAYNDPTTGGSGESFLITAVYNQLAEEALSSADSKWMEQWESGFDLLTELHPYMYSASGKVQYPAKNQGTLDLLANGSVDMVPAWADMVLDQKEKGLLPGTVKITQLNPAFTGGLASLGMPVLSDESKVEACHEFLNYVVSPEGQEGFIEAQKAIPVIDQELLSDEANAMLAGLEVNGFRSYTLGGLTDEIKKKWQQEIATLK